MADHPAGPDDLADLLDHLDDLDGDELAAVVQDLPPGVIEALLARLPSPVGALPPTPLAQAVQMDEGYRPRDHLDYLSTRLAAAADKVQAGQTQFLVVSMPPRSGKSTLASVYLPVWILRRHPDWKIGLISHSPTLAVSWGRQVRRIIEEHGHALGITLAKDAGAASEWQTTAGGGVVARSAPGQSITGLGFKVMLIDDAVKDFAAAHSQIQREALWSWWLANAQTRLEPPALVGVIGTRWHEDDLIGRLLSAEHEGDPGDWEVIELPAIATEHDALGRAPGEPLLSPLLDETPEQAIARWEQVRSSVGSYTWSALYQQRPAPAKGAIFDTGWWRFWTTNPAKATDDGKVIHLDPSAHHNGRWLDSWDMAFKGTDDSDYVVGQRWLKVGPDKYLIGQSRARRSFTSSLAEMREWGDRSAIGALTAAPGSPLAWNRFVHERLVEDKANGTAVIDVLRREIDGLIPVNPTESKQARARAVTPQVEAGNVYLPLPSDPGNEWVTDLLSELREFPTGAHDDQVDALTQALMRLRDIGRGSVISPNAIVPGPIQQDRSRAALSLTQMRIPGR